MAKWNSLEQLQKEVTNYLTEQLIVFTVTIVQNVAS